MSFSEWKESTLNDIADITMGQSPKGEFCNNNGEGVPLLNGPTEFGEHHPYPTQFTVDVKKWARKGDLLFCVRGSTTGRMNWADRDYAIGRGIAAISPKHDNTDRFIKCFIEIKLPELLKMATGSTFPNVSRNMLIDLCKQVPEYGEMIRINNFIRSIEDKIDTNNQINKNIEEMAQAIFKQWFVDFEFPNEDGELYKSSGGELVESEFGMIPRGWNVIELEEVAKNITRGMTPKYEDISSIKVLNQKVNKGKILEKQYFKYLKEDSVIPDEKYAYQWDILLNSLGQGTLGRVHLYKEITTDVVVDQHISIIRCKNPGWAFYIYNLLDSSKYQTILEGLISGSTGMLMLNISKVRALKIVKPSESLINKFEEVLIGLYNKIEINNCISEKLGLIRESLLPKLMSGEIGVPLE